MPKKLNEMEVVLSFNADTRKAKQEIDSLQQALQNVAKLPGKASTLFGDKDIKAASNAAMELQMHLQKAFNTNTGKLDLSRLSTSLKASGQSLDQYYDKLSKAGAVGQDAFLKVARSVATAEAPVTRVNARMEEMLATLKNTARWQISSSILHGFMGTIQEAYHYAQDLNESLNNIRIVTGYSKDRMADFAVEANKAAQALSTTTTEYTDASLIFYQQGLNDKEVKERTETTIKMANVSRQSAEEVSDQMTAVWNNFNKSGDESAEHFADVMTKLGAETASSSSEIATGLEKFAGIANTIGLSFDYASSALATITATSRETPEVVGTALKTIFARIQGLKLGETLEDGTDLNKYSEGLAKVGISIKDTSGEMKKADTIISEMGAKWKQLSKDQQMALAQTVAGTRQYNQLVTLMDNFDFFEENVDRAKNSEGTLQEQQNIYAEGWEAARDRVKAVAEDIYQDLFDDEFFIGITNGLAKVLDIIDGITESFGGLKGIVATVGGLFLTYYANKVPDALNNLKQNFMVITGQSTKVMQEMQAENAKALANVQNNPNLSLSYKTQAEGIAKVNEMQQKLVLYNKNLTTSEQEAYKIRIQNVKSMFDEATAIAGVIEKKQEEINLNNKKIIKNTSNNDVSNYIQKREQLSEVQVQAQPLKEKFENTNVYSFELQQLEVEIKRLNNELNLLQDNFTEEQIILLDNIQTQKQYKNEITNSLSGLDQYTQSLVLLEGVQNESKSKVTQWKQEGQDIELAKQEMQEYLTLLKQRYAEGNLDITKEQAESIDKLINTIGRVGNTEKGLQSLIGTFEQVTDFDTRIKKLTDELDMLRQKLRDLGLAEEKITDVENKSSEKAEAIADKIYTEENAKKEGNKDPSSEKGKLGFERGAMAATQFGSAVMSTYAVIQTVTNGIDTLNKAVNGNASAFEALGAVVSIVMSTMQALNAVTSLATTLSKSQAIQDMALTTAKGAQAVANKVLAVANIELEATMSPILVITLAIIAAIGILIGIIYGAVKAFQAIHEASPEGQLESSTKEVERLSSAYEELTQKVSDLKSELEQYQDAKKALSEMTSGTEEWKEAVLKLNEQVMSLIDKYPELAKGLIITNGVMSIDEDTIKEYTKTVQQKQTAAGLMKVQAQGDKSQAQISVNRKENRDILPSDFTGRMAGISGQLSGSPLGINAESNYKQQEYNKVLDAILKEGSDILNDSKKLKEASGISTELADKIVRSERIRSELLQEAGKEQAEQLKIDKQQRAAMAQYLSTNVENKNYQDLIKSNKQEDQQLLNIINNGILQNTKEGSKAFEDARKDLEEKDKKEIEKLWAEANDYTKNDDGDYVNKSGQEVDFDKDEAIKQLAQIRAAEQQTEQDFDKLIINIKKNLNNFNQEYKNGLISFLTEGTADNFTKDQANKLKTLDPKQLLTTLGLNEEIIKSLGYKSAEDFKEAFEDAINSSEANLDTYLNSLPKQVQTKMNQLRKDGQLENLTNQQQTQIGQSLENANNTSITALNSLSGLFDDKTTNVTGFADAISKIDWSSVKNIKDVTESLQKSGGIPDSAIESVKEYAKEMTLAAQAAQNTKHSVDDTDVTENKEQWQGLSDALQGVSKALNENREAAEETAAEIMRFDHAAEEVTENYEEWMAQLSSDNLMDNAEAVSELRDLYGDLLDIDSSNLSAGFISSTENLELMKQATEGSEEAYKRLQELAQQDMESQLHIGIDDQEFWDSKKVIQDALDQMNFQDLEVGTNLDIDGFLEQLTTMVNAADMTQQQATDYLSNMGIDAEVETETKPITTKKTYTGVKYNSEPTPAFGLAPLTGVPFMSLMPNMIPEVVTETAEETQEVAGHALKVTSANKSSGGKFKFNNSSNGSGAAGQKARSSSNKGSGGSSKQPKQPQTKEHKDPVKEIADRYHDLNKAIQDVEHSMSMLSKTQEHLKGTALVKSLKEQNKLLERQKGNYQALNNELRKEQGELQWILSFAGGSFGADGSILNYTEVFNNIKAEYNRAVDAYNGVIDWFNSLSGEQQDEMGKTAVENAEKILSTAKETYDEANKYLKRYDEVYSELQKNDEKLKDLLYEQIENNLKAFEVEIQVNLDISEAQRKINDFLRDVNKNFKTVYTTTRDWVKLFNTAIKNAKSFTGATGTINTRLREIQEVRNIIDNPNYDYNSGNSLFADRTEAVEKLKEYTDELMSEAQDLYSLYEDTWNSYLDAMDESLDQWNDILSGFEEINDTLDHYQKIAEMLYGGEDVSKGRELLDSIYSTSSANSLATQSMLRQQIASLTKEYQDLVAAGAKEGDEDLKKVQDAIKDANKNLQSEIENYLDVIQNKLTNSIKSIMDTADKALTRGFGINKVNERWNDAKEAVEGYYDEVEKVYQLESLESKWEKAINDTSTIKNQQYLKVLMDGQLSNLRAKTKLSEYDIQLAEKELAIYQAQMALEDARNNKNTMKLTRNEQGDWTYQYVADEDDTAAKEEELLNALYEKYEFVKQSSAEAMEAILNMKATADEKLSELMEQYKIADEERRAELAEEYEYWYSYYYGEDGLIVQKVAETQTMETDLQTAGMETVWGLYETDQDNFDLMTNNEKEMITTLTDHGVDSLKTLELGRDDFYTATQDQTQAVIADTRTQWQNLVAELIKSWNTDKNSVRANVQNAYAKMMQAVAEYDAAIVKSEQASGIEWSKVNQQLQGTRNEIQQVANKIDEVIGKTDGLDAFRLKVSELENQWYGVKGAIEEAIYSLEAYLNILTGGEYGSHYDYGSGPGHSGGSGDSGGGDAGWGGGDVNEEAAYGIAQNIWTYGSWGNDPVRRGRIIERYGEETANRAQEIVNEKVRNGTADELINWDSDKWAFATGGYTGEWGKEGRLALLHQKELVLNEEDTKNILDTVNVVRSIKDSISSMVAGVTGLKPSITTAASVSNNDNKVFNITAEFPNANSVTEIQEAILGLPNLASQWMSANT